MLCSWVDNWFDDDINFQRNWIRQHASDGGFLGKPVCTTHSSTSLTLLNLDSYDNATCTQC